jgi:hypothetical protein
MKIRIDVDCSPDEARAFFGLPDVAPMQRAMMEEIEKRMRAAVQEMSAEALMKTWGPTVLRGFEEMQRAFWSGMGQAGRKD